MRSRLRVGATAHVATLDGNAALDLVRLLGRLAMHAAEPGDTVDAVRDRYGEASVAFDAGRTGGPVSHGRASAVIPTPPSPVSPPASATAASATP